MESKEKIIKILLSYHKKDILFKDDVLTPIHAGREIAIRTKDPKEENLAWLMENTLGDNSGENISNKNALYNEMTTVYWAWKNYTDLGNPDYIGFMHYRRHFIFKEKENPVYECAEAGSDYYDQINYSRATLIEIMENCDFVCTAPYYRNTVYEHYKKNHDIVDLDCIIDIIDEKYSEYKKDMQEYLQGDHAYFCNMFIFDKKTFFEYCSWFFDITFELEKRRDMSGKRLFVSEWLTGIFITKLINQGKKGRFFPTIIIEGEHNIPVVLAADNNYAIPMYVTITSLLETAKPNTIYNIHLLMSGDFSEINKKRLEIIRGKYPRHHIIEYNMKNEYSDIEMTLEHITSATYYRLKLPTLLKGVNKCIYLDVDLIVVKDLSEMFRINVDDKYIAGVRAAGYYWPEQHVKNRLESLQIPSIEQYVNAGVLIMNLSKMRKDRLDEVFEELLKEQFHDQDQDILNKACYDKIRIIPFQYNVMTKYGLLNENSYKEQIMLQMAYSLKEWDHGRKNPTIIHYADRVKPWNDLGSDYSDKWWEMATKLPFFNEIFMMYSSNFFINAGLGYKQIQIRKETEILKKEIEKQTADLDKIRKDTESTVKSTITFRIGAVIVFIPRKVKGGIKCICDHGLSYTIVYGIKKILNK